MPKDKPAKTAKDGDDFTIELVMKVPAGWKFPDAKPAPKTTK